MLIIFVQQDSTRGLAHHPSSMVTGWSSLKEVAIKKIPNSWQNTTEVRPVWKKKPQLLWPYITLEYIYIYEYISILSEGPVMKHDRTCSGLKSLYWGGFAAHHAYGGVDMHMDMQSKYVMALENDRSSNGLEDATVVQTPVVNRKPEEQTSSLWAHWCHMLYHFNTPLKKAALRTVGFLRGASSPGQAVFARDQVAENVGSWERDRTVSGALVIQVYKQNDCNRRSWNAHSSGSSNGGI